MYTIGQVAKRARVNTDSVRFYERQGLLAPARKTSSGYRLYTEDVLRRIDFIKHAQRCGFSLAEIRSLIGMRNGESGTPHEVCRFVHEKQAEIDKTIAALRSMSALLAELATANPGNAAMGARNPGDDYGTLRSPLRANGSRAIISGAG